MYIMIRLSQYAFPDACFGPFGTVGEARVVAEVDSLLHRREITYSYPERASAPPGEMVTMYCTQGDASPNAYCVMRTNPP